MAVTKDNLDVFREQHAALSFHVAAMMVVMLKMKEAEHMVTLGHLGNAGGLRTEFNYHRAKVKALVASM